MNSYDRTPLSDWELALLRNESIAFFLYHWKNYGDEFPVSGDALYT